jgi:hypothetical protein
MWLLGLLELELIPIQTEHSQSVRVLLLFGLLSNDAKELGGIVPDSGE